MDLNILIQVFLVLGVLTALFRYNAWYKICEYTFIAVSLAVTATVASRTILNNAVQPLMKGDLFLIIPIAAGILYLTRVSGKYGYLARISMAIMVGATLGSSIRVLVNTDIIGQILPILQTQWAKPNTSIDVIIGNLYLFVGVIASLIYFVFSTTWLSGSTKRSFEQVSMVGRYALLAMIGAQFANTTMGRMSVFMDRIYFLLKAFGLAQ